MTTTYVDDSHGMDRSEVVGSHVGGVDGQEQVPNGAEEKSRDISNKSKVYFKIGGRGTLSMSRETMSAHI
jgi:hypothetical protein